MDASRVVLEGGSHMKRESTRAIGVRGSSLEPLREYTYSNAVAGSTPCRIVQ